MDGKGCWRDNVFVERLWRSAKYEEVYLNAYASVPEARAGIGCYIDSTMPSGRIPRLAAARPTRYISTSRFSQRQSTYPSREPMQTNRVTSVSTVSPFTESISILMRLNGPKNAESRDEKANILSIPCLLLLCH